ncbi:MAG TPA: AAA family ATPase [Tepidisphaeraceae bacterium]|jgi:adenylate kinase family enzyme|nr:AAA family ATPase [Tepidisphaeraceae bacterium]
MRRVVIVGSSGAGKTTLASALAQRLRVPHVEIDSLNWESNWTETPTDLLWKKIESALAGDAWAVCGNYTKLRELIWPRADTLIRLDYPMGLVMWQVLRRTVRRCITQEMLWATNNVESWRKSFFSSDSIIVWAWTSWRTQRRNYSKFFRSREYPGLRRYRFVSPAMTRNWLDGIGADAHAENH